MKSTDLATTILAAVLGIAVAFFITNAFVPEPTAVSFKKLEDTSMDYNLTDPSEEVFNYRALNPTVEVYVGDCTEFDEYGECITPNQDEDEPEEKDNTDDEENKDKDKNDGEDEETPTNIEPDQENQNGSTD